MKQKVIGILLGFAAMLILIILIFGVMSADGKAPEILFKKDNTLTYIEGKEQELLLEDVTAMDNKDGDVSDSLVVESVYNFNNGNAKVIYVARDSAGNMAKAERIIKYTEEENQQPTEPDNSDTEGEADTEGEPSAEGETETETDQATEETLTPNGEKPVLRLTENQVNIAVGAAFSKLNYVDEIVDDKDDRSTLFRRIIVRGTYDVNTAGTYELEYYATDSDGNATNMEKLTLVVQ